MQFPKTGLDHFISTDLQIDNSPFPQQYQLFNTVCQKSSYALPPQQNQISPHNNHHALQRTKEILSSLSQIFQLMKYIKSKSKIIQNSLHQFILLNKGIQIIDELLSNCLQQPSPILIQLKEQYLKDRPIQAQYAHQVNTKMLTQAYDFIQLDFIPSVLTILEKHVHDHQPDEVLISELKIRGTQILMFNLILPSAIDTDQDDIFTLSPTHNSWVRLNCITQRKSLGNQQKIRQSFDTFVQSIQMGHALVQSASNYNNPLAKVLSLGFGGIYYFLSKSAAEKEAKNHTSTLSVESAYQVMNFVELPGLKHILKLGLPKIKTNLKFYIDPVVLPIIIQDMNQQLNDGILNTITPKNLEYVNQEINDNFKQIFIKNKSKLRIRLLHNQTVIEQASLLNYLKSFIHKPKQQINEKILIHIHGGGFISQSSSSHQCYTRDWAIQLDVPIFSIDYSLSPKHPYPIPLDDCWQAYQWILKYSERVFNISPKKIIIAGDSAGGNLATALTGLIVKYQSQLPIGLILNYPSIDLRFQFTPSYLKAVNDKILTHTMLGICIESYSAHPDSQLSIDPFISPLLLSYEILKHFPPVRMFCGSVDPLYDQVFRFAHKLTQLQKDVKITIYDDITHGYLSFNTIKGMPEIQQCIKDNIEQIRELFN